MPQTLREIGGLQLREGCKLLKNRRVYLVTAGADGGTYYRNDVPRITPLLPLHHVYGGFTDLSYRTAPSCVRQGNDLLLRIGK